MALTQYLRNSLDNQINPTDLMDNRPTTKKARSYSTSASNILASCESSQNNPPVRPTGSGTPNRTNLNNPTSDCCSACGPAPRDTIEAFLLNLDPEEKEIINGAVNATKKLPHSEQQRVVNVLEKVREELLKNIDEMRSAEEGRMVQGNPSAA